MMHRAAIIAALLLELWNVGTAQAMDLRVDLEALQQVDAQGKGHRAAMAAWQRLVQADARRLPEILAGMRGANPLAENWFRAAVETIWDRQRAAGSEPPIAELERFLADTTQAPRGRRLAYELIAQVDAQAESRLIPRFADDPSLELRRDAVALLLKQAAAIDSMKDKPAAIAAYTKAFGHARDPDQILEAFKKLKSLGEQPDLPRHFGFVTTWKLIGPFENADKIGFDAVYPPENEIDLNAKYSGKGDLQVAWLEHTTEHDQGMVDLNKAVGKHMGAAAYAFAEFFAERDQPVQLRLGCVNANKVWLNGKLLTANHIYHTGHQLDQYIAQGELKKGRNVILLKILQNEQTDDWAQNWQFQLRVCDAIGTAVLSQDRNRPEPALSVRSSTPSKTLPRGVL